MRERAAITPAEVLYHSRRDDAKHRVYLHRSEEAILCTDNHQIDRTFIQETSFSQLQRSRMQYIHIDVLQVRLQILHRREEGTLALVLFRDNRWQDDRSIIATMEVDLSKGSQLIYVIPDIMMTIGDFFRNIQLSIATRGYETWQNGEANFLVIRGLIGRLSSTPNVAFAYEVNGVVDYLTSHGVIALPGRRYTTRQLQGLNWVVCPTNTIIPLQPREVSSNNLIDGRLSISFSNYQATPSTREAIYNRNDDEAPSDEEELRLHTIAILIEEIRLLVRRLYPLPRKTTSGAAGYDLPINRAQDVPANSRALLTTGLSIKVPDGTCARIAARSEAALKRGILIGVDIVDSDFRGDTRPEPSVHRSIGYPMTTDDEFLATFLEDTSNSDAEDIQDSLNSYFSSAIEGGGEKELPYPTKITSKIVAGQELEENWELEYPQLARLSEQEWEHKYKRIEEETMNLDRMIFEKEDSRKEIQKLKEGLAYQKGKQIEDNEEINMLLIDETQKILALSSLEIIKKIIQFNEEDLTTKRGLRSWLGILNYARNYIPNLGKLLSPLYAKTSSTGERKMNQQDWELVKAIKDKVRQLPDLEIPPPGSFIILEVDGCISGWGGICKWKARKNDPKSTEKGKAQFEGGSPPPKDYTHDLIKLYRVKVEEINERTKIGLRLDILHKAERLLGQIQNEAAQQAIKSLQQYREIHSIKLQEYKR
ncbi:hypothetical protein ZIOFF_060904 [Zingiber officinale]|uniref:dUTPase-like domain-containing protein n=1 Tax=Zingiber officinale TaxID=94328 RepID=A0A8J5KCE3_ZINOF|nr:hypothetical protein ZIOFF_060904 [Zingiber officinale]